MKSMMGENRIFVGHVVRVYGGSKKFMAIIGSLRYPLCGYVSKTMGAVVCILKGGGFGLQNRSCGLKYTMSFDEAYLNTEK